jgi:hypothetical protein
MKRIMVSVSILLLLLAGISFVVLGIALINESRSIETGDDASAALILGVYVAFVGSFPCLGATYLAVRFEPWRPQQKPTAGVRATLSVAVPLVCSGILFLSVGRLAIPVLILLPLGVLHTLFGSILCLVAWRSSKHDGKK